MTSYFVIEIAQNYCIFDPIISFHSFSQRQQMIHNAFCDNIDTKTILDCLRLLVTTINSYLAKMHERKATPNGQILKNIAQYVTRILKVKVWSSHLMVMKLNSDI